MTQSASNNSISTEDPTHNFWHKQRIIQETELDFMVREHFLSNRVVLESNKLPENVINSKSLKQILKVLI